MRDWLEICSAAGFDVRKMKPTDVYLTAGKIIADSAVSYGLYGRAATLRAMTPEARLAVRERAAGVVRFQKPAPTAPSFFGDTENVVPNDFEEDPTHTTGEVD